MAARPLLIFPQPHAGRRLNRGAGPSNIHIPNHREQVDRIGPRLKELQRAFEAQRAELRLDPGRQPERVLVLEIVGQVDEFIKAVRLVPGMQWLAEWEQEGVEPDDYFYIEDDPERRLNTKLYLIMSNQTAMDQLVHLWARYRRNPREKLERGLNRWRQVFGHLKDVRFWDQRDRLTASLVDFWNEQLASNREMLFLKAELWFSPHEEQRAAAQATVERLTRESGGRVLGHAVLPQIAFHAVACQIPADSARQIIELAEVRLLRCHQVMFLRPLGQAATPLPEDRAAGRLERPVPAQPEHPEPVIALLDGLPLTNHELLIGRIALDDPDAWSEGYQAAERIHGTMMSSLIAHGELDSNEPPLSTAIYVRPILRPDRSAWRHGPVEMIPEEIIPEDLLHRAVRRLFVAPEAVAPSVKIVALAIGDPLQPFDRTPSPLARLVDWLSWEYQVLFLISAGNHTQDIELNLPRGRLRNLPLRDLERATLLALESDAINRRLLSPGEAINALTIGAIHSDASAPGPLGNRVNPYTGDLLPSPVSAIGLGYRRGVKPDILFEGGRQLFLEKLGNVHQNETLQVLNSTSRPPGQRAAAPGPGQLSATRYYCGTSNATALAARRAAQLYEVLRTLRATLEGAELSDRWTPVLLKAMLVHGSSWEGPVTVMQPIFERLRNRPPWREYLPRFLGYGQCRYDRLLSCSSQRATLLGWGQLTDGEAHTYRVPLPPSLSGNRAWRRLTITLAWLTPIDPLNRYYRCAALWFVPPDEELLLRRCQSDSKMTQRGTVQHEVLEGTQATAFVDGEAVSVQVNCRAQIGTLQEHVPYAIAVTLETAEGTAIPIYEEIRDRLRIGVQVQPNNPAQ